MSSKRTELTIVFPANPTYDEVVDTIADVFEVGIVIDEALGDGFQPLQDIIKIASQENKIREVINDIPVFLEQFTKLDGPTAVKATLEVRDRVLRQQPQLGKVTKFILGALFLLAKGFTTIETVARDYVYQREGWGALFSGGFTFPEGR